MKTVITFTFTGLLLVTSSQAAEAQKSRDTSLPVAAYVQRGCPAPDRAWSSEDLEECVEALHLFEWSELPRLGSDKSGLLFRRIVATDGIGSSLSSSEALERLTERATRAIKLFARLELRYENAERDSGGFMSELMELKRAEMQLKIRYAELVKEALKRSFKEEQDKATLALENLNEQLRRSVSSVIERFEGDPGREFLHTEHSERLIPQLIRHMTGDTRRQMELVLKLSVAAERDPAIAAALKKILAAI